jgi:hypothetical protein
MYNHYYYHHYYHHHYHNYYKSANFIRILQVLAVDIGLRNYNMVILN